MDKYNPQTLHHLTFMQFSHASNKHCDASNFRGIQFKTLVRDRISWQDFA